MKRPDGTLFGHNTDYDGFAYLIDSLGADIDERTAAVFGNGEAIDTFISFMDSPSKTYDGQPAAHPEVYTNSPGDVRLSYRGHTATDKTYNAVVPPTEAGDYTVTAQVAASGRPVMIWE